MRGRGGATGPRLDDDGGSMIQTAIEAPVLFREKYGEFSSDLGVRYCPSTDSPSVIARLLVVFFSFFFLFFLLIQLDEQFVKNWEIR